MGGIGSGGSRSNSGRRPHSPYERGITVRLPSLLVDAIDEHASDTFDSRSHVVRTLLEAGLAAVGKPLIRPRRVGRIK